MNKYVYVVMASAGEYEDQNTWAVKAYIDKSAAEKYVETEKAVCKEQDAKWQFWVDKCIDSEWNREATEAKYGPQPEEPYADYFWIEKIILV